MAKPTGGLLAFSARGSVAKTIVFSAWRGRQYVRQHVIPANPRSSAQTSTRNAFSFLMAFWKNMPESVLYTYTLAALGRPLTNRNLWAKINLHGLRAGTGSENITFSPGAKGGLALVALTNTFTATTMTATATVPTTPPDWTLDRVEFIGFPQIANDGSPLSQIVSMNDTTSPYSATFTGLVSGVPYQINAWPVYTKPDGSPATGLDLSTLATPA